MLTLCFWPISFKYLMTSALRAESSPLVGSSRNRIFGFVTRRLAIESLFFCPPLRPFLTGVPTMVWACDCRPKLATKSSTRFKRSFFEVLLQPELEDTDRAASDLN